MKVLIKQAKILDSSSEFNGEIKDVLLINGKISDIPNEIKSTDNNTVQIRSKNNDGENNESHRKKISDAIKKKWEDPKYRKKAIKCQQL